MVDDTKLTVFEFLFQHLISSFERILNLIHQFYDEPIVPINVLENWNFMLMKIQ
jgi:hypothetical protein